MEDLARAWVADDPDPATRATVERWLASGDRDALTAAFGGTLRFGTSGIRGPIGPGPAGMNRRTARRIAAGLAAHIGTGATVVVGRDARILSPEIAGDIAAVLAGAGVGTLVLPGVVPTPLVSFAVRRLGCDAGVMITASHNPRTDNGVKVYAADGAQIVPPTDAEIAAAANAVTAVLELPLGEPEALGDALLDEYLDAAAARVPDGPRHVRVVHTALHGVGAEPLRQLFRRSGFAAPHEVPAQAEPDGTFPSVAYPNPEEAGALDLAIAEATRIGADVVLATDPDADRLGVAVPDRAGWRVLTGDEIAALLAEQALATTTGPNRVVASSYVSSRLVGRIAAAAGARWVTTPTGFKWLARAADDDPAARLVFAYEEALGFAVHDLVRDKDGLTAAIAFAALVAHAKANGETVAGRLERIAEQHGLHLSARWSALGDIDSLRRTVDRFADDPPDAIGGIEVTAVRRPVDDLVVVELGDDRVMVRPSGTEPKVKAYVEVVTPLAERAAARDRLETLRASVAALLTDGSIGA